MQDSSGQPHTSAGRIPTAEAYRYYVEQISGEAHLSHEDENIIHDSLAGITDVQEFMERRRGCLSMVSRNVGVTVAVSGPKNALEHVYFSRLGDQKGSGSRGYAVRTGARPGVAAGSSQSGSGRCGALHQREFRGWTMDDMRAELQRRLEKERSEYDRLMQSLETLYRAGRSER